MEKVKKIESFDSTRNHCIEELHKLGVVSYNGIFIHQLTLPELKTRLAIEKALKE